MLGCRNSRIDEESLKATLLLQAFDDEGQSAIRAVTLSGNQYDGTTLVTDDLAAGPMQKVHKSIP